MLSRELELRKALSFAKSDERFNREASMQSYYESKVSQTQAALDAFLKEDPPMVDLTDPVVLKKLLKAERWVLKSIQELEDRLRVHKDTDMTGYYTRRLDSFKHELAMTQERIREVKNVSI